MMQNKRVIWTPQPRQAEFMSRPEYEVLYGGAAGGGKSDALVAEALRQVGIPHYRGLIMRKTYPECETLIDKTRQYYKQAYPKAKYNESKHVWTFPSGAKIYFGSMQYTKDKTKYQGQNYDFIGIDELTHFAYEEYTYLKSRNRPNGSGTRVYMRCTCNPGGIGHAWVKQRWIDGMEPGKTYTEEIKVKDKTYKRTRAFIPASVFDNKILLENDPEYVATLGSLPEADRNALLYGDWNSFSGQVFCEWADDMKHYKDRLHTHVIDPFRIPQEWSVWCSFDWGYSRPFSVGWYAVDRERRMYRIRELYGCTGTPNEGVKWEPSRVAAEIKAIEMQDENLKGRTIRRVGDPAIWGSNGTESIGALMERERVYFEKGDHARIDGKMQVHHRLAFDDNGVPLLYVFKTCKNFIRTVPALIYDDANVEDINTDGEDHIYDELRYVCMKNPIAPPLHRKGKNKPYNPLSTDDEVKYGRYEWYSKH